MNNNQKLAIDTNIKCLTDTLRVDYVTFATHLEISGVIDSSERQTIEESCKEDKLRGYRMIQLIKEKFGSWNILLGYLKGYKHADLADSLRKSAEVESVGDHSVLSRFTSALAKFYKSPQSANIPSLWGDPKSVRDFWVPLRAEEKTKVFAKGERLDYAELLKCLADREDSDVALVIGDPGTGKTTLVKKITYDWAVIHESNPDENHFKLVLSVPLRSVGKFDDFYDVVELTIDYFFETLTLGRKLRFSPNDKSDLIQLVNDLDSKLLIILDGLDEYNNYDESLFKSFFAPKFSRSHEPIVKHNQQPLLTYYKLIITSRPYACEQMNMALFLPAIKFQLCLLDKENLATFVEIYCQTQDAKIRVKKYINEDNNSIGEVPLILSFICYLADSSKDDIPANLTLLYDKLIRQMLRREGKEEKLEEMINSLGRLAYGGCKERKYEFAVENLDEFHVSNDGFVCGFLLEKFDFADNRRKVEFRHRSVQDFFAVLHCFKMFLENNQEERAIMWNLVTEDHQDFLCRFFLGMCSNRNKFGEMIDWISDSFCDRLFDNHSFKYQTADCTTAEKFQLGHSIYRSLGNFEEVYVAKWNQTLFVLGFRKGASSPYVSGINLKRIQDPQCESTDDLQYKFKDSCDYYISVVDQPRIARVLCIKNNSPDVLEGRFDLMVNFFWVLERQCLQDYLSNRLNATTFVTPMRTVVMTTSSNSFYNATFVLKYSHEVTPLELKVFRFDYDPQLLSDLLHIFGQFDTNCIKTDERESEDDAKYYYRRMSVTVVRTVSQTSMIWSLIKQSLIEFTNVVVE